MILKYLIYSSATYRNLLHPLSTLLMPPYGHDIGTLFEFMDALPHFFRNYFSLITLHSSLKHLITHSGSIRIHIHKHTVSLASNLIFSFNMRNFFKSVNSTTVPAVLYSLKSWYAIAVAITYLTKQLNWCVTTRHCTLLHSVLPPYYTLRRELTKDIGGLINLSWRKLWLWLGIPPRWDGSSEVLKHNDIPFRSDYSEIKRQEDANRKTVARSSFKGRGRKSLRKRLNYLGP